MKFINKYLRNLAPYKVASHKIWEVNKDNRKNILKLDWNEATIPPSPLVKERLLKLVDQEDLYFLYPSTYNQEIMELLSNYCQVDIENIQYFASSDSLHEYLVRMFVSVGDPILLLGPTYDNFRLTCESQGGKIYIHEFGDDFIFDPVRFEESIQKISPSLIYICNPNNPTGNIIDHEYILYLLEKYPDSIFLIDEAYYEFYGKSMKDFINNYNNLFISRTFSKAFALANFRAGYLISDKENIKQISKIRNPKNFTTFAQEAVIGVLSDVKYMENYVLEVNETKKYFVSELEKIDGIRKIYASEANFVLVEFNDFETKTLYYKKLIDNDIFVRDLTHSILLTKCLRITVGNKSQMERVVGVLFK